MTGSGAVQEVQLQSHLFDGHSAESLKVQYICYYKINFGRGTFHSLYTSNLQMKEKVKANVNACQNYQQNAFNNVLIMYNIFL
jgi:hypothetical protein